MKEQQEDYLFSLFDKLSQKLNKPINQMKPYYFALKDNWYDNEQALREITDDQYNQMKIPGRLVNAIKQQLGIKIKNTTTQKQPSQNNQTVSNNITNKPNDNVLNEFTMIQYTNQLQQNLTNQYKNDLAQVSQIFQTLYKIIHNIIADPYELKFRTLKKSNSTIQKVIVNHVAVAKFLALFGFEEDGQKYYLNAPRTHELIFIEQILLEKAGQYKKYSFQPFIGDVKLPQKPTQQLQMNEKPINTQFQSFQQQFSAQKLSQMKYVDALQKLIQFRHQIMSKPPKDRQLRIYHKKFQTKNTSSIPQVNMKQQFQKSEDKIMQSYWAQMINQNRKNSSFQSKRKQQFQFLVKQKIHKQTIIKIKLPNELIIEARFGPLEKLKQVINVACQIVVGDLYLFHAPPPKRFDKDMQKTLFQLDSVPMGSFYLGINGQWYIQNQFAKIIQK